jgi:pyruvate,water dikinase
MNAPTHEIVAIGPDADLPPHAGGKALGLRDIARCGLPVPPAWVVFPGANGALTDLEALLAERGISRVAVRSSSADEDGRDHSFAGIHETALGVGLERLRQAVAAVATSPLGPRADAYRRERGLPAARGPCAVVVQAMLDAEWAGVAFGRGDGVLIEAVEGLGEVAVSGDATPEALEVARDGLGWRIARRWPRRQAVALRADPAGVRRDPLEGRRAELPEAVALQIVRGVAALERAQGKPLDVEWAARGGQVAFLQARPQTRPLEASLPPGETWTRTNARDTAPEIASPLARALAVAALDRVMHTVYRKAGLPVAPELPLAAAVAGRVVFNERALHRVGDALGMPRSWMHLMVGGPVEGAGFEPPVSWRVVRRLDVVFRISWFMRAAERRAWARVRELQAWHAERSAQDLSALGDQALAAGAWRPWAPRLEETLLDVMRVTSAYQNAAMRGVLILKDHPAPLALLARLVAPEPVSVSTRQMEDLVELARALRGWTGVAGFFTTIGPEHAVRERWRAALPDELWARTDRWLKAYGHRGPYESDPAQPRLADDLRLLAAALGPLVLGAEPPEAVESRRERRRADHAAAWREVNAALGPVARLQLRSAARDLGALMVVREALRSALVLHHHAGRLRLVEMGRRLAALNRLDAPEEVLQLTLEEAERALLDPGFDARTALARERARVAAWRRLEVPNRFTTEEIGAFGRVGVAAASAEATLRGTAVSPGEVEGRVCVLRSPDDQVKMLRGGILVAPTTDPGWTPLFALAAGVVVELGGVMSHAGTVAREYGLPAVSNVEGATARLRDGDLVRLDGTRGTVEVLERGR